MFHRDHRGQRRPTPAPPEGISRSNRVSTPSGSTELKGSYETRMAIKKKENDTTLFCFRALFSFIWGQSFPVTTDLISETGTGEKQKKQTHNHIHLLRSVLWRTRRAPLVTVSLSVLWQTYYQADGTTIVSYSCHWVAQKALHPEVTHPSPRSAALCDSERVCRTKTFLDKRRGQGA